MSKQFVTKSDVAAAIDAAFWFFLVVTTLLVLAFAVGPLELSAITLLSIVWGTALAGYLFLALFVGWRFQQKALCTILMSIPPIASTGTSFRYIDADAIFFGYWLFVLLLILLKELVLKYFVVQEK